MKLGEAKEKIAQINTFLDSIEGTLKYGPASAVAEALNDGNELLKSKQLLQKRIREVEETTLLEGNVLSDVISVLEVLNYKVHLLEILCNRAEGLGALKDSIHDQLNNFRTTRDALKLSVSRCLWETEILDE